MQKRLAIIGTGIAGLACAYFLQERFDITMYEQNDYIGGHTNTVEVQEGERAVAFDTGFMVFNHATYPNLVRLFRELNVETRQTDMSFSVQDGPSGLEYGGGNLDVLFGQRRNLLSPRFWRMLLAIDRFNNDAVPALDDPRWAEMSLREYVNARGYGEDMFNLFLVPMSSAVWSTPPEKMEAFPAQTLLRFWHNHGFLGLQKQHQWWTVCGGSKNYVKKLTAPIQDRIHVGRKVVKVTRQNGKVQVHDSTGGVEEFDKVILACHGDQSLALLGDPTELETRLLREFKYQPNTATVHSDTSVMPKTRRCWSSWNYRLATGSKGEVIPETHYWMNMLQGVSDQRDYFVSLNCHDRIAPDKIHRRIEYEHPLFDLPAIRAQKELPSLNQISPDQTTYYCGAWFKYGFHEDGFTSGLECSRAVTGEPIWAA